MCVNMNRNIREMLEEAKYMEEHPEAYKAYSSAEEMLRDILGDDWDKDA